MCKDKIIYIDWLNFCEYYAVLTFNNAWLYNILGNRTITALNEPIKIIVILILLTEIYLHYIHCPFFLNVISLSSPLWKVSSYIGVSCV